MSSSERLERAGKPQLIVRVDRLEPSKNVLRGFLAFEALLQAAAGSAARRCASWPSSRSAARTLPEYARYAAAVREVVARVNGMADPDDAPIWLLDGSDYALAIAAMQLADVVLVNPVVDGMNLVAKEAAVVSASRRWCCPRPPARPSSSQPTPDGLGRGRRRHVRDAGARPRDVGRRSARRAFAACAPVVRGEDLAWWLSRQLRDLAAVARGGRPPSRALRDTVRRFNPELRG